MSKNEKTTNLELLIECEVRDKYGRILGVHRQQAKSLLKNFAKMLRTILVPAVPTTTGQSTVSLTDTGGTSKTFYGAYIGYYSAAGVYAGVFPMCANAPSGNDAYGILVGTSASPVNRDQYQLGGKIAHGSGSGQLSYGAMTVEDTDGTPPDTVFRLIRTFTNNTTDPITVYEIGLTIANCHQPAATSFNPTISYFLIARDVLSSPQTIPAGATLTVRYIFKVTA
jgi:hypothetical protein